jgi:feruloyl esterase
MTIASSSFKGLSNRIKYLRKTPVRNFVISAMLVVLALPALPVENCEDLKSLTDEATSITVAERITTGSFTPPKGKPVSGLPAFCRVAATLRSSVDSAIRIELWMPSAKWNGRLEGTGNGGFAGNISYGALADGLKRGFAVVNTDMGMATPPGETADIFVSRPERWKDWGYRATHEMTVAAKRLVGEFYGHPAVHNYFVGCSTGGEQALMEAQRYPDDYEGIIGGAPANNRTRVHMSILWNFVSTESRPEDRIPPSKLPRLAAAVMSACDRKDGLADGVISDPDRCDFDPGSIECHGSDGDNCLTHSQVLTARRLYAGPKNPRTGTPVYPGMPKGSELGWDHLGLDSNAQPPYSPIFRWVFGKDWNWRSFDFDRNVTTMDQRLASDVNATSPDLGRFRSHGHKLLTYHGWADWLVVPNESILYRNSVLAHNTGKSVDDYYRLFMVPGMTHCSGGVGPDHFDAISAMMDWVENGKAPDVIVASKATRTLPLCVYPKIARYRGTGDVNDAANFTCQPPGA